MTPSPAQDLDPELLPPGSSVGEYVLEGLLGSGGFARVYRARHAVLQTTVAIKVLTRALALDASATQRFVREAQAASKVAHPNVVRVRGFGMLDDGRAYQVLDLIEGDSLERWLANHPRMPPLEVVALVATVASALDAAHARGIVHRDLKPSNILVVERDGALVPYLTDFGIAKALGAEDDPKLTFTGITLGTPTYMSPEQALGTRIGPASDVYALGVVTFELLTGQCPFDGESPFAIMMHHVQTPAPAVSSVVPELGRAFDVAVARMLAKRPEDRPGSSGEAAAALQTRSPARSRLPWLLAMMILATLIPIGVLSRDTRESQMTPALDLSPPDIARDSLPLDASNIEPVLVIDAAPPPPPRPKLKRGSAGSAPRDIDSFETPPDYTE